MMEGEEVKPYRMPVTLMQSELQVFFLLNVCASTVGRDEPGAFNNQNIVCMYTHVHVCDGETWRGGSLYKKALLGSFKNFSPDTKCMPFYSHCCRRNRMSSVSVADFIDHGKAAWSVERA